MGLGNNPCRYRRQAVPKHNTEGKAQPKGQNRNIHDNAIIFNF